MSHPTRAAELSLRERRVLDQVDMDYLLDLLAELIAFRSLGGEETAIQERVAAELDRNGMAVDTWEIDIAELSRHPAYSAEIERSRPLGVVGQWGRGDGKWLMLDGHVDVVPEGDPALWSVPPWQATIKGGAVYGLGAVDMKGGLAAAITAVRAVREAGVDLLGSVLLASVVGEEDGGAGTLATLERGYRADGAVIMEPTETFVAPAHAGALTFRLSVPGYPAHGCVRGEGVSALERFVPVHGALLQLEAERNDRLADPLFSAYQLPYALSIGTVRAGDWSASVPDRLVCEGRYGVALGEDPDAARAEFETAVAAVAAADPWLADHPPTVEWWGGQFGPASTPLDDPMVTTLTAAHATVAGAPATTRAMTYGADMRLLVDEGGIPSVLYGPGDVRAAHRSDEHVAIGDLRQVTETLALTIVRFCGAA